MSQVLRAFVAVMLAAVSLLPAAFADPGSPLFVAADEVLRGRFAQDRVLAGFETPIHSEGEFTLAPGRGLIWQTETPFATVVVITAHGMVQKTGQTELMRLSASEMPYFGPLYRMLESALSGDWKALAGHYELEESKTAAGGRVVVKPMDEAAGPVPFTSVAISYSDQVDRIDIRKPDGDTDTLLFDSVDRSTAAVDADEQALFDAAAR